MDADDRRWTQMNEDDDPLTRKVIGAAFAVSRVLGHGFLETVYKNALRHELVAAGLDVTTEKAYPVFYRGEQVGTYTADLVVADALIVELKTIEALGAAQAAQLLNYLKASQIPTGLLLNFSKPRIEIKRIILQTSSSADRYRVPQMGTDRCSSAAGDNSSISGCYGFKKCLQRFPARSTFICGKAKPNLRPSALPRSLKYNVDALPQFRLLGQMPMIAPT